MQVNDIEPPLVFLKRFRICHTQRTLPQIISAENMSQPGNYEAVRKDIVASMKKPDYDDGSLGPVFVRLAW